MATKNSLASRARKAIVAGFGAGVSAVGTSFVFTGAPTRDDLVNVVGIFVVAFFVTAFATFQTKNAPEFKTDSV